MCAEEDLRNLLSYELASAKRFRRFVSLVMLRFPHNPESDLGWLKNTVRQSDQIFILDSTTSLVAILMPETDGSSALRAIARYKNIVGQSIDIRTGVASFPMDIGNPGELLKSAYRRISKAMSSESGKVVCVD